MSRIINKPIKVEGETGVPVRWVWRGGWRRVERFLDAWRDTGRWWAGESEKTFYRIATGASVMEIYRDEESGAWFLYKVYD